MEHKDLNILEKYLGKEFITELKYKYEFANRKKHKQRIGTVKRSEHYIPIFFI